MSCREGERCSRDVALSSFLSSGASPVRETFWHLEQGISLVSLPSSHGDKMTLSCLLIQKSQLWFSQQLSLVSSTISSKGAPHSLSVRSGDMMSFSCHWMGLQRIFSCISFFSLKQDTHFFYTRLLFSSTLHRVFLCILQFQHSELSI